MDHKFKKSFEVLLNNLNSLNIKKIMVSGIFIGESEEKRNERLKMIREILGDDIQIIVQGIETIEQVILSYFFFINLFILINIFFF